MTRFSGRLISRSLAMFGVLYALLACVYADGEEVTLERRSWQVPIHAVQSDFWKMESNVLSLYQDHSGDIWIGSKAGISKYTGSTSKRVSLEQAEGERLTESGVACKKILARSEDSEFIWAMRPRMITRIRLRDLSAKSYSVHGHGLGKVLAGMATTSDQKLWVALGSKIYRFIPENAEFLSEAFSLPDGADIVTLESRGNTLYVGSKAGGLHRFDVETNQSQAIQLSGSSIDCLTLAYNGQLLAFSDQRIFQLTDDLSRVDSFLLPDLASEMSSLAVSPDMRGVWLAGRKISGLGFLDFTARKLSLYSDGPVAEGNSVKTTMFDRTGLLWAGYLRHGVYTIDTQAPDVSICRFSPGDSRTLSRGTIIRLKQGEAGSLWSLTYRDVARLEVPAGNDALSEPRVVERLALDPEQIGSPQDFIEYRGERLLLTSTGLYRFDSETRKFVKETLGSDRGNRDRGAMAVSKEGKLWIIYGKKLVEVDWENRRERFLAKVPEGASQLEAHGNNVWIGTFKNILRYNCLSGELVNLTEAAIKSDCKDIEVDGSGRAWIANKFGIFVAGEESRRLQATPVRESVNFLTLDSQEGHIVYGTQDAVDSWLIGSFH
ncbi:MAG: two-component regulator propeller domain-containing protein, partial [Verrucomicrobiota bacterium]